MFSKLRDPLSALTHFIGAAAAGVGVWVLLAGRPLNPAGMAALAVYGASLVLLFLSSAIYHSVQGTPRQIENLRKLDHSAIYLLIAGSYTPFCVIAFGGFWQWGFLAIIWTLAAVGILTKLFLLNAPRWITAGVYVLMGWLSVFGVGEMLRALPVVSVGWLFAGGVAYTVGAVIYITKRMDFFPGRFGFHEVWHIFVMLGAAAHYVAIASFL